MVLGHTLPAMRGEQDGLEVIDILSRHPSTAKFISKKLAQRFVADDPPKALVDRMAATFTSTDGDLRAVLQTLFSVAGVPVGRRVAGEGEIAARDGRQQRPRATNADVTDTFVLAQRIADLGEPLYGKVEPTGYPNTGDAWASTAGIMGRINFATALTAGQLAGVKSRHEPLQLQGSVSRGADIAEHGAVAGYAGGHRKRDEGRGGDAVAAREPRDQLAGFSEEIAMWTRRFFLRASAVAMAGVGVAPAWLVRAAAQESRRRRILVAIFQRGAADGLNIVVPFFEKRYYEGRPTIAVPPPGKPNGAIDLDGRFGLHPSLQPLKAALGRGTAGDRRGGRFTGSDALALRRAGLHGVGHTGPAERGRLVEPRASGRSHRRHRRFVRLRWEPSCRAPSAAPQPAVAVSDLDAVSGPQSTGGRHSREHVRHDDRREAEGVRQGNLRRGADARIDRRGRPTRPPTARSIRVNSAAACSRSRG